MLLSAIRASETWGVGSAIGAVVLFAALAWIVWVLASKSAE
jgi:hypothetical protein